MLSLISAARLRCYMLFMLGVSAPGLVSAQSWLVWYDLEPNFDREIRPTVYGLEWNMAFADSIYGLVNSGELKLFADDGFRQELSAKALARLIPEACRGCTDAGLANTSEELGGDWDAGSLMPDGWSAFERRIMFVEKWSRRGKKVKMEPEFVMIELEDLNTFELRYIFAKSAEHLPLDMLLVRGWQGHRAVDLEYAYDMHLLTPNIRAVKAVADSGWHRANSFGRDDLEAFSDSILAEFGIDQEMYFPTNALSGKGLAIRDYELLMDVQGSYPYIPYERMLKLNDSLYSRTNEALKEMSVSILQHVIDGDLIAWHPDFPDSALSIEEVVYLHKEINGDLQELTVDMDEWGSDGIESFETSDAPMTDEDGSNEPADSIDLNFFLPEWTYANKCRIRGGLHGAGKKVQFDANWVDLVWADPGEFLPNQSFISIKVSDLSALGLIVRDQPIADYLNAMDYLAYPVQVNDYAIRGLPKAFEIHSRLTGMRWMEALETDE